MFTRRGAPNEILRRKTFKHLLWKDSLKDFKNIWSCLNVQSRGLPVVVSNCETYKQSFKLKKNILANNVRKACITEQTVNCCVIDVFYDAARGHPGSVKHECINIPDKQGRISLKKQN